MFLVDFKTWSTAIMNYCVDLRHNEALSLFIGNLRFSLGFKPNHQVFAAIIKSSAALSAVNLGKALHGYAVKRGHFSCQSVSKALLNMYAKCGELDDCKRLFDHMDSSDPVIWNIILSGFSGSRFCSNEVMRLFNSMHLGGEAKPNPITIATILPVCARLGDLKAGKRLHSYAVKSGFEANNLVGNALVSMYSKCGLVCHDAFTAFERISQKDVVSWNAIIAGLAENGLVDIAFKLFSWMLKEPTKPNYATIATILPVCALLDGSLAYRFGKEIHCYVLQRTELVTDVYVCNSLVSFYLRLGKMEEAECLFQKMKSKDLVSWNAIIAGYALNGQWLKALDLFSRLLSLDKTRPDSVSIVSILPACAHLRYLEVGKRIHGYIYRHSFLLEDTSVGNAIISFYAKCNNVDAAFQTFSMMSRRDLISWNSMLDAFAENGYDTEFLSLIAKMFVGGTRPDSVTILTILRFCSTVLTVEKVKETHGFCFRAGYFLGDTEPTIGNAVLDAYAKCGSMEYAFKAFKTLSDKRNLVTCNSMIPGYVNCGSHKDAYMILDRVSETDLTTWNLMVRVFADNDSPDQAIHLFRELQARGKKPNAMTIMSLLPICAQMASVHLLRQCHAYVVRACFDDVRLGGALLDLYAKCGIISSAYKLFQSSPHKDVVMFTSMIGGFAMHGMGKEALKLFSHMLEMGLKPDHVIITSVLSACSHAGVVSEGLEIFHSIEKVYGMKPTMEQYACVVDLIARAGQIDEALSFVTRMPVEANANIWGTLLGACRTHQKVDLGCFVADRLFEAKADNIGNYVVMSNLYAAEARWDGVANVRKLMRNRDLKKPAGCSWIEIERTRSVFVAGDSSHPERSTIYSTLSTLDQQMKNHFRYENISSEKYGTYVIFSVKLTMAMQIIGFSVRFSSSFLWIQIYRLGISYVDAGLSREADFDLRNSFLSPATPAVARQTSGSDEVLGGSIYDPTYYSSLFEDGRENRYSIGCKNHSFGGNGSTSDADASPHRQSVARSFQSVDEENAIGQPRTV